MDRAAEAILVVFYCIGLLTVIYVPPLMDEILTSPSHPPRTASTNSPETLSTYVQATHVQGMTNKGPVAFSYSYTTSGYESKRFDLPVDLKDPPLAVWYQFTPKNVTRTKTVTSEYGRKETELITYEMPSEDSWLRVKILDEDGDVVDEGGFGRLPGEDSGFGNLEGKVSIYRPGKYIVQVRFNEMMGKFSF